MVNELPIKFQVGNGGVIVSPRFNDGVLTIAITRNNSDMTFVNGQTITSEQAVKFREQVVQIPDAIFEFTDIELGLNFYKGFFKTPNKNIIDSLYTKYLHWHLSICA